MSSNRNFQRLRVDGAATHALRRNEVEQNKSNFLAYLPEFRSSSSEQAAVVNPLVPQLRK
jgi:hypothetical protein